MAGHIKVKVPKVRKRLKRKVSIRFRISGTAERPRLSVFRSAKHVYAQAIDDVSGRVIASASDIEEKLKGDVTGKPKKERARAIGKAIGEKLLAQKIEAVVFDRNGFIYHGRVKEVADGARDAGLKF
ncbi:MAG: 50S ribosomal protein L18 [Deltaproteobacteria bacterium]|nr:50S ribosomal protein L18 [Deltaproteobacteria bacterium]